MTAIRHGPSLQSPLYEIEYDWTLNNWVDKRTETDHTVAPATETVVGFAYDNRGRLIGETRQVDGATTVYDISYTYDQLGNRLTKSDSVAQLRTDYAYDVHVDASEMGAYVTHHNRLLYYEVYDTSETPEVLLRTVKYTYYKTGQASNITIKDEGVGPEYDTYQDLALYHWSHGPLWRVIWGEFERDANGDAKDYRTTAAREFRSDSARARFMMIDYDTHGSEYPSNWTLVYPTLRTDYAGDLPYRDVLVESDYSETELTWYLGTLGQQPLDPQTGVPTDTQFLHGDLIGSTNLVTDGAGNPAVTLAYTAFGETIGDPSAVTTRYQYAGDWGYESDLLALDGVNASLPAITLQHVGHRWYEPDTGRFVQRDPIGIDGGLNVYAYVFNHPVGCVDPSGSVISFLTAVLKHVGARGGAKALGTAGLVISAAQTGKEWGDLCQWAGRTISPSGESTYDTLAFWCLFAWHYPKDKVKKDVKEGVKDWLKNAGRGLGGRARVRLSCFVAGTEVHTPQGMTSIERLGLGGDVLSGRHDGTAVSCARVTAVASGSAKELIHIGLDGETLTCTSEHPFWVVGRGWVKAGRLRSSDKLQSASGEDVPILSIQREHLGKPVRVYNITVDRLHTYHVGKNRVLVHNKIL